MYDAIVVGARAAGSPTAMLLARKGHRVLLVDRATFPSDTLSTHYIHQPGVARLRRWGLLDRVVATGCPPARDLVFDAAAEAGAEVRTGLSVDELVFDDGAVVGIRSGDSVERARFVIGADGRNSFVAGTVTAPAYDERPGLACAYYTYWG